MQHKTWKKIAITTLVVIVVLITLGLVNRFRLMRSGNTTGKDSIYIPPTQADLPTPEQNPQVSDTTTSVKPSVLLPVPFTAQAPTANWDELHNEACEEADVIMAAQYFSGNHAATLPASLVETEISKLTTWQKDNFGYYLDITTAEAAQMAEKVYGLKTKIIPNFTEADVKTALSEGKLVIISENGRLLNNPNYKQPGPIHHMLIIKGYDAKGLITNDSGTRNGQSYRYTFKTVYNAAADWVHDKNTTDTSIKAAIIVWK